MREATDPGSGSIVADTVQAESIEAATPERESPSLVLPIEVEAKFTTTDSTLLQRLAGSSASLSGYTFGDAVTKHIRDIYLDTPDRRLLRHGYHLRARVGGGQWLATLKSSAAIGDAAIVQRMEIEVPLAEPTCPTMLADLPDAIASELAPLWIDHNEPLITLCVLNQTRIVREVAPVRGSGKRSSRPAMAAMSLDEVAIRRSDEGEVVACFHEIELELLSGADKSALQPLAERFMTSFKVTPSSENKLIRSLIALGRHPVGTPDAWEGVHPQMHMGDACRAIWCEQFTKMLLNEAGIRNDSDAEFVHNARVAIRRCRAAATLYGRFFKKQAIRKYLKRLRRTARLLGAVRDMDVAIARMEEYRKGRKNAGGALRNAVAQWSARRAAAREELLEWLDSPKYANFVAEFIDFCQSPGEGIVDATPQPGARVTPFEVRHVTPTMLAENFEAVRAYELWFERKEEVPSETLHRLRIECKYLRYNLEFVSHLLGKDGSGVISLLKKLQEDLGSINDAAVSRDLLAGDGTNGDKPSIGRYIRTQEKIIVKLSRQIHDDFTCFVAKENRRHVFHAISNL